MIQKKLYETCFIKLFKNDCNLLFLSLLNCYFGSFTNHFSVLYQNVINWSHNREIARFNITIGVAYGSDLSIVKRILENVAIQHPEVDKKIAPEARFINFGESSLDFQLLFFSSEMFRIEKIKSDLRFEIDKSFRKENIQIPFPQRDIHIKSS